MPESPVSPFWQRLKLPGGSEMVLGASVVAILVVMILPVPTPLLDILLTFNITFGIIVLLTALYTLKPLDFSIFPSLLLLLTLYRLSLNVASTRLILLKGSEGAAAAGQVINAFGHFVVGGNYLVGLIVFIILVVINFMVITKGSGRIAEVAARFTLDAMPGKQMAIDADLNAGLIDELEAKDRRATISREADFYGAMDGASKFVRGDAIAGIIITLINIVAGLIIGIVMEGMDAMDAVQTYTILTVGDGLVSQIPALIISTSAGIIVSRAGTDMTMGNEMGRQFTPQAQGPSDRRRHRLSVRTDARPAHLFLHGPGRPGVSGRLSDHPPATGHRGDKQGRGRTDRGRGAAPPAGTGGSPPAPGHPGTGSRLRIDPPGGRGTGR